MGEVGPPIPAIHSQSGNRRLPISGRPRFKGSVHHALTVIRSNNPACLDPAGNSAQNHCVLLIRDNSVTVPGGEEHMKMLLLGMMIALTPSLLWLASTLWAMNENRPASPEID